MNKIYFLILLVSILFPDTESAITISMYHYDDADYQDSLVEANIFLDIIKENWSLSLSAGANYEKNVYKEYDEEEESITGSSSMMFEKYIHELIFLTTYHNFNIFEYEPIKYFNEDGFGFGLTYSSTDVLLAYISIFTAYEWHQLFDKSWHRRFGMRYEHYVGLDINEQITLESDTSFLHGMPTFSRIHFLQDLNIKGKISENFYILIGVSFDRSIDPILYLNTKEFTLNFGFGFIKIDEEKQEPEDI